MNETYDIAVIGGGPSGAALATFVRQHGHTCIVLEKAEFPRYHIGESLIPHAYGMLDRLGLLPALKASSFPKKYSVRFIPETGGPAEAFYFSETIKGEGAQTWQVERSQFDRMCLDNARASGVVVTVGSRVQSVLFDRDRAVGVRVETAGGRERTILASVVVDASGRATILGRQLGLRQAIPELKKASIWTYFRGGTRLEGIDAGETAVYMLPQRGWFWYIPLPDDIVSVGIVADPAYLNRSGQSRDYTTILREEIRDCAVLADRLRDAERIEPVRGLPELAYRNRQVAGDGWVMVGDAVAFLDPIYSSGLFLALASAEMAAESVHGALTCGDVSAARLGAHTERLFSGVGVIYQLVHAFYDPEFSFGEFVRRFPEHRAALIDCLVGDVFDKDMSAFQRALAGLTPAPAGL